MKKNNNIGITLIIVALLIVLLGTGCSSTKDKIIPATKSPSYPETSFSVISDLHFYDTSLGKEGSAFEDYMKDDRKLLVESEAILQAAMEMIKEQHVEFVIIPGDLTKDGEKLSHEGVAASLKELENSGIEVYVVPGNHDINNPHAHMYLGNEYEVVDTLNPRQFQELYNEYGFDEALFQDSHSLSYVAEPAENLWLLAIDSANYDNNFEKNYPETDGSLKKETLKWIEEVLASAYRSEKAVIAMLHHNILEHYNSQNRFDDDYVLDDYKKVVKILATHHVRIVFTGHFHAQDIRVFQKDDNFLFDIQTGSLVTYPNPVRRVRITEGEKMEVSSHFIWESEEINRDIERKTGITNFREYSKSFTYNGIAAIAYETIQGYGVKPEASKAMGFQVADAFTAHLMGDEVFPGGEMIKKDDIGFMGRLVAWNRKKYIQGLWHDEPPADNNTTINLATGEWED